MLILMLAPIKTHKKAAALALCGMSLLLATSSFASPSTESRVVIRGEARHPVSRELIYVEDHKFVRSAQGQLLRIETEYFKASTQQLIARMNTDFREASPDFFPNYKYEDLRREVTHEVKRLPGAQRKVELSRLSPKGRKSTTLDVRDNMVTGQGILLWLERELPRLLAREKLHVRFVLPAFLDDYGFEAFKLRKASEDLVTLQVQLDHWFFRLFSSPIEVDMHVRDQRFVAYRGPGNVMGENGKPQTVHINYAEIQASSKPPRETTTLLAPVAPTAPGAPPKLPSR
jgi:hypothetical protein